MDPFLVQTSETLETVSRRVVHLHLESLSDAKVFLISSSEEHLT